jgi:hypothetical protein
LPGSKASRIIKPLTQNEIAGDLRSLGLRDGDSVMLTFEGREILVSGTARGTLCTSAERGTSSASGRIMSIDALRGFDMFWIIGGNYMAYTFAACLLHATQPPAWMKARQQASLHQLHGAVSGRLVLPAFGGVLRRD